MISHGANKSRKVKRNRKNNKPDCTETGNSNKYHRMLFKKYENSGCIWIHLMFENQ